MQQVTVSSRYQIVIPRSIREKLGIQKGQTINVMAIGNRIVLIPDVPIEQLRGALPVLSSEDLREGDTI